MRPATILVIAVLVFPGLVLAVAPPTEPNWTYVDIIVGKNGGATDADGGTSIIGATSINTQDGAAEIWVGTPTSYTRTTISDASNACIRRGATDTEWLVGYEDTITDTLQFIRSTNTGVSWSSPSQVLPIVSTSLECDLYKYATGTIIVAVGELTNDVVYAVRSTDNGATWEAADTVENVATQLHNLHIDNDLGIYYEEDTSGSSFIYRETSTNDGQTWGNKITVVTGEVNIGSCGGWETTTGDHVVTYNDVTNKRMEYARSTDGGATYTDNQLLYDYGGATSGFMDPGCMNADSTSLWVSFSINAPDQFILSNTDDGGVTWDVQVIDSNPFTDDIVVFAASDSDLVVFTDGTSDAYLDEYYAANPNGAGSQAGGGTGDDGQPAQTAPTVTLNITPIVDVPLEGTIHGFDLSPDGQTIIVRQSDPSGGFNVTTYRGTDGSKIGEVTDDDFMVHGVVAGDANVAWVDKTATGNDGIKIRNKAFGDPIRPSGCANNACPADILDLDEQGAFPDMQSIQDIQAFNPDYRYAIIKTIQSDYSILAFGFTTSNGDVGAFAKLTASAEDDEAEIATLEAQFEPSGVPDQMTAWTTSNLQSQDGESKDYVGAASFGSGGKVWLADVRDDVTFDVGAGLNDLDLFTSTVPVWTAPVKWQNANGIAGWDSLVAITDADSVGAYNIHQGFEYFDQDDTGILSGTLSITQRTLSNVGGTVLAYVNATEAVARAPGTGNLLATGYINNGTAFATGLDGAGSRLVVVSNSPSWLRVYDISPATCTNFCGTTDSDGDGVPDSQDPDPLNPDITTTTTTGTTDPVTGEVVGAGDGGRLGSPSLPGIDFASLSGVGGISASAWAWVIGFMLVLFGIAGGMVLALTVLGATPGAAVAFAMGGGALGIIGAVAFSLWPVWPLLVIILLAILAVLGMRGGSG